MQIPKTASILSLAEQSDFSILEMEVDKDHIHRRLKQISTHRIWQSHPTELRQHFEGAYFLE
jgi:REP element-mobilizing transposase RayT